MERAKNGRASEARPRMLHGRMETRDGSVRQPSHAGDHSTPPVCHAAICHLCRDEARAQLLFVAAKCNKSPPRTTPLVIVPPRNMGGCVMVFLSWGAPCTHLSFFLFPGSSWVGSGSRHRSNERCIPGRECVRVYPSLLGSQGRGKQWGRAVCTEGKSQDLRVLDAALSMFRVTPPDPDRRRGSWWSCSPYRSHLA